MGASFIQRGQVCPGQKPQGRSKAGQVELGLDLSGVAARGYSVCRGSEIRESLVPLQTQGLPVGGLGGHREWIRMGRGGGEGTRQGGWPALDDNEK